MKKVTGKGNASLFPSITNMQIDVSGQSITLQRSNAYLGETIGEQRLCISRIKSKTNPDKEEEEEEKWRNRKKKKKKKRKKVISKVTYSDCHLNLNLRNF